MTHPTLTTLGQDELLQLARNASGPDDSVTAVACPKEAASRVETTGAVACAESVPASLAELAADGAPRHAGAGLRLIIKNQLDDTAARLGPAIARDGGNAPLNKGTRKLIDEIARV